ncbi:hypothetical protein [Lacisediminihabitans changchengi]|uniref:Uncharacterized protein n=1 Tax=Lacisediminihabitans changchengi TaxID=2787634 RepID=A0A934SUY3_9MICO|nr:hypothetical protein [Lacisediminihabitans changchengi]MBK4348509.1 hypothetical protein [Lacisediminihabitans changchengi]
MTAAQLIRVVLRRWYVVIAVLILTAVAVVAAGRVSGVYSTQLDVVFVAPSKTNSLEVSADSLVQFAAVIERRVNGADAVAPLSGGSTLYGEGIRSGWAITLPNSGGQWQTNFNQAALSIEVVDSTPERVRTIANDLSAKVSALALQEQVDQGVAPISRVTTLESPANPVVSYIEGRSSRAKIGIIALGVGLALFLSVVTDRLAARLRQRRAIRAALDHEAMRQELVEFR